MNEWLTIASPEKVKPALNRLCDVLCIPVEDVLLIPNVNPQVQTIDGAIQVKPGKTWLSLTLSSGSAARGFLEEEKQETKAGTAWKIKLSGKKYGHNVANHLQLNNWANHRWILLATERFTGITYLLGKLPIGATIGIKYDNSKTQEHAIEFNFQSKHRCPVYNNAFAPLPDTPTPKYGLMLLVSFRIGQPGRPTDADYIWNLAELAHSSKIIVFVDGRKLPGKNYGDVPDFSYDPTYNRITSNTLYANDTVIDIYQAS